MTDLTSLLERVEKAEGPDRELDSTIVGALRDAKEHRRWHQWQSARPKGSPYKSEEAFWERHAPPYTSSLDAALALVEEVLPGIDKEIEWVSDRHSKEVQVHLHCPFGDEHGAYVAKGVREGGTLLRLPSSPPFSAP